MNKTHNISITYWDNRYARNKWRAWDRLMRMGSREGGSYFRPITEGLSEEATQETLEEFMKRGYE